VDGKEGGGSDLERAMARKEWKAAVVVWSDLVDGKEGRSDLVEGKEGKEGGGSGLEQAMARKAAVVIWSNLVDGKEGKEGGGSDLERSRGWQGRQGRWR
jgi:hypothetical protein